MRFEGHGQYWEIEHDEASLTTRAGRIGTRGRGEERSFATPEEAARERDRQIIEQLRAGYRVVGPPPLELPPSSSPELVAAICEHRDDPAPYLVHADWLQAQGNPFGELMALMQQGTRDARGKKRIDALLGQLGLPLPDRATFGWRFGLWSWLRIDNPLDDFRSNTPFDEGAFLRGLLSHPACAALEELRIGSIRWLANYRLVPAVIDEAAAHPWARHLVRLHVGDVDPDVFDRARKQGASRSYDPGRILGLISRALPALRSLQLRVARVYRDEESLDMPRLTELVVEGDLTELQLEALLASRLPVLESFSLPAPHGLDHRSRGRLRRLLDGEALPSLRRLGMVTVLTSTLVEELAASPLAARLERLELRTPRERDRAWARTLAANARQFPALAELVVDDPSLSPSALEALARAFPRTTTRRATEARLQSARR